MMSTSTFLFERNGFKVFRISTLGFTYFIAERPNSKDIKRYIRKSLNILEKIIDSE